MLLDERECKDGCESRSHGRKQQMRTGGLVMHSGAVALLKLFVTPLTFCQLINKLFHL